MNDDTSGGEDAAGDVGSRREASGGESSQSASGVIASDGVKQRSESSESRAPNEPAPKPPSELERLLALFKFIKIPKKNRKKYIFLGVALFFALIVYWGMQPRKGSIRYGVCLEFARTMLVYPFTLRPVSLYESGPLVSLDYSYRDPFGNDKSERLDCVFGNGANGELVMNKATIIREKREKMDKEIVEKFSRTIPAVIAGKPNLVLPPSPGESLQSLKVD